MFHCCVKPVGALLAYGMPLGAMYASLKFSVASRDTLPVGYRLSVGWQLTTQDPLKLLSLITGRAMAWPLLRKLRAVLVAGCRQRLRAMMPRIVVGEP